MLESSGVVGKGDSTHVLSVKSQYYTIKMEIKLLPVTMMALSLLALRAITSHPSLFRPVLQPSFCLSHQKGSGCTGSSP